MPRTHRTILFCWLTLSLASPVLAFAQSERSSKYPKHEKLFAKTAPVRPGDRCIVCNTPLRPHDTVYLVEGQRVGIMEEMEPQLFQDPWAYLARLKPRGGLFGGEVAPQSSISDAWLFLGIYVILGLAFSAVCAHRALDAGQPPVRWFLAGLFLNVFGYLALLVRSADRETKAASKYSGIVKIPSTADPAACPHCERLNHPSALRCSGCGAELTTAARSEVTYLNSSTK